MSKLLVALSFICMNSYANVPYQKPICQKLDLKGNDAYKITLACSTVPEDVFRRSGREHTHEQKAEKKDKIKLTPEQEKEIQRLQFELQKTELENEIALKKYLIKGANDE